MTCFETARKWLCLHDRSSSWPSWLLALTIGLSPIWAVAETLFSGFGTLGGAISDQDYLYQRFIDDQGTLSRDSVFGVQLDADLTDAWRVTLQGKVAPADDSDSAWAPSITWAFLSWRPSNDLFFRLGKFRLPLMLYSANSDVGVTFDFARLPTEVYSMVPTTDVVGLSASKTWLQGDREWTLDGYAGRGQSEWRYFLREGFGTELPGPLFIGIELDMVGLVATMRQDDNRLSIGLHHATANSDYGRLPTRFPFVPIMPGVGYYQIDNQMPGPGIPSVASLDIYLATVGAELALPHDFRLIGEYARRQITNATMGPDTNAAYLALLKSAGRWTPYAYCAYLRSTEAALDLAVAVNNNSIPALIPGAALLNASQATGADLLSPYDQHSFAIGTSYRLSPTSKLKAEWMHTRTGRLSSFVNAPANEDSGRRKINVFSLSYSFVF